MIYELDLFRALTVKNTVQGLSVGLGFGLEIGELCCGSAEKPGGDEIAD